MVTMAMALGQGESILFSGGGKTTKRKRPIKKIIPKGMKEFHYDGIVIYALNKKNADRKYNKSITQ